VRGQVREVLVVFHVREILAALAALRAKVMDLIEFVPRVALADSGNPGLLSSTPSVSSGCRAARGRIAIEIFIALLICAKRKVADTKFTFHVLRFTQHALRFTDTYGIEINFDGF
jgi:hypothetical protein